MPFNDLPPEIIQYVFSLCCQGVKFRIPQEADRSEGTTQVTLSLVCSRWRAITLNTGALWGDVMVVYDAGKERDRGPAASFQFVQNWLNRAGMTQISLYICISEASESQIAALSQALLSSFCITNLHIESLYSFLLVPTNNSSHLERLYLSFHEPARMTDIFPRLPEMPSLKELHLCLHPGDFVDLTNCYLIPWHQLRVFTLSKSLWASQVLFNILQRCTSLVECTLVVMLQSGQPEYDIVLPNLESLVLDMNADGSTDPIIRSLNVPNLRSLEIRCWSRYTKLPLSPDAIAIMAQRSGFNKHLTNFSLCLTEQAVDVRSLLGSMPALKSVQLHGPLVLQPGTFDDLSSGTIGPQLEDICFGVMSDEEIGLLLEAVGQRHEKAKTVPGVRPFAFVTGHCTSESDSESHKQRAKKCSEAFNSHVSIVKDRLLLSEVLLTSMVVDEGESDSDLSMGSDSDEESYLDEGSIYEELGPITIPTVVFVSDEEPVEESNSGEESHSSGEESHEESYSSEASSSESHWESDPDVGLDSHSGGESDPW